jgi:hypothetical protein
VFKDPAITLRCDCGAEGRAGFGERWTCSSCGRVYDTDRIPESDYRAVAALNRRYRLIGFGMVAFIALLVLLTAITQQLVPIIAGLGVSMLLWFLYLKPLLHTRHRKAVAGVARKWKLRPEEVGGE